VFVFLLVAGCSPPGNPLFERRMIFAEAKRYKRMQFFSLLIISNFILLSFMISLVYFDKILLLIIYYLSDKPGIPVGTYIIKEL